MFDTLMKLDKDREVLDFYATDKRATKELLIRENFRETINSIKTIKNRI